MMEKYKYIAFISYKREDENWAKWLQYKLEHYKLPASVRKSDSSLPERVRPIFKDTTDLAGGVLAKAIKEALDTSKYLIVICSPRAAQSVWVCKEVQEFIDSGREEYIIPFIIDGEPNSSNIATECFPQNLRNLSGKRELLGININEMGRDAAAIKVVARMFGLHFDSLWQRFLREKRSRITSVIFVLSLLIVISINVILTISKQRADINEKKYMIENQLKTIREQLDTIEAKSVQLEAKNVQLEAKNDSLKQAYMSNEIALAEIDIQKEQFVNSFFRLYALSKYKSDLKLNPEYSYCLLSSYKSICRYPTVLTDIYEDRKLHETWITHGDDTLYVNDSTCIWMENEESLLISCNAKIIDTISHNASRSVLTNDGRYLVYSDRDSVLYFYDTTEYTSKPVFKSRRGDLFVWFFSFGGVMKVSYDNNQVLYVTHDRRGNKRFIIDIKEQRIIHDTFRLSQKKKSPDGTYVLTETDSGLYIKKNNTNRKIELSDPFFDIDYSYWSSDNKLITTNDTLSLVWSIRDTPQNIMSFHSSDPIKDINLSPDNKYVAILTTNALYVYDLFSRRLIHENPDLDLSFQNYCTFSTDSKKIACVDIYGTIYIYDFIKNTSEYLGGYYNDEGMANCGELFQISFVLGNRFLALYNNVDYCYALFDLDGKKEEIVKHRKIVHLDDDYLCFENDSVLRHDQSNYSWSKMDIDSLALNHKKTFPVRIKPVYINDLSLYWLPKQYDIISSSWDDLCFAKEENQSYSYAKYNSDSTLFIIVNPYNMHISNTDGILDELYYQCLF